VAAPDVSEKLQRLSTFVPIVQVDGTTGDLNVGPIRDVGTLRALNIRLIVDQQMTAGKALFGYKPHRRLHPGDPLLPLQGAAGHRHPGASGVRRLRAGRLQPLRDRPQEHRHNAASSQMGDAYGVLTVA
jgi:hypothetical protein